MALWDFSAAWQLVLDGLAARDDGVRRRRLAGAALEHAGAALQDGRITEGVRQAVVQRANFCWSTWLIANSTMNSTMSRVIMSA